MENLNVKLMCRGFKKVPHAKKTEELWRRDRCVVMRVKRRFPKAMTAVLIQGSSKSDGTYILGTDDDKLELALARL